MKLLRPTMTFLASLLAVASGSATANEPLSCQISGMAQLYRDYGDLKRGAELSMNMQFKFNGKIGIQEGAEGSMVVEHAGGDKLRADVYFVQSWDRKPDPKTSKGFEIHIHGSYRSGDIGGLGGVPRSAKTPWSGTRPGIVLRGNTAGLALDGKFPVTPEQWALLSDKQILTLADPAKLSIVTYVAGFKSLSAKCKKAK